VKVLIQRVNKASVRINGGEARPIGRGLCVFVGIGHGDSTDGVKRLAMKAANLRIFPNDEGKFDRSVLDIGGEALVVSQFTLYGDCGKGRRPDFTASAPPEHAEPLYRDFVSELSALGVPVKTGEFGAKMEVEICNDGPVTLWLES